MRFRLGGWAVALLLVLSSCGVGRGPQDASPPPAGGATESVRTELVSARDTLPLAPPSSTSLTVLLVHAGSAADPGLDAAAGALAQRPDVRVDIAVGGTSSAETQTMSGFPVAVVNGNGNGLVPAALAATGADPDLVVVGIARASALGGSEPIAATAAAQGIPALVVEVEDSDGVDRAAAAMQLLEVLDLELDALLDQPAGVHRLTVPSCRTGSLRERVDVRATPAPAPLNGSDCTSADRSVPADELAAVGAGYAALARVP
jgi:hypothetical protein